MATLTKQTTNLDTLANYTLHGGPLAPMDSQELSLVPHRPAQMRITFPGSLDGAAIAATPIVVQFNQETADQLLLLSIRTSSNPAPTVPDRTTLLDVIVDSNAAAGSIPLTVFNALTNNAELFSVSTVSNVVIISTICGGNWTTNQTSGSTLSYVITPGTRFNETIRVQTGANWIFGANSVFNFARNGVQGLISHTSTFSNTGFDVFFTNQRGGGGPAVIEWDLPPSEKGINILTSDSNLSLSDKIDEWITANNISTTSRMFMERGSGNSIDVYYRDGTVDMVSTHGTPSLRTDFGGITVGSEPARAVSLAIPTILDPHKEVTQDGVRFIDTTITSFGRIAPNSVFFSKFSTWDMSNFKMVFDAGYRFDNSLATDSIQNWYGVRLTKVGDSQGTGALAMLRTNVSLICNWRNCGWDILPNVDAASSTNPNLVNGIIANANNNTIILNWIDCYLNYFGNGECDFLLGFDTANSLIERFQVFSNGTGAPNAARILISTFDDIRLLSPSNITDLGVSTTQFYNPLFTTQVQPPEIFTNMNFEVGKNFISPNVASYEIATFQNRNAINARLDFQQNSIPYLNNIAYVQLSDIIASVPATGKDIYATTFSPTFSRIGGGGLPGVRNEFRYGDTTETIGVPVKELIEAGPVGGISESITRFEITNDLLLLGTVFTIPRPHGQSDVTITAVSGTPVNNGAALQFNPSTTDNVFTVQNILNAVNTSANDLQIWCLRIGGDDISNPFAHQFVLGNAIGGTTSTIPFCSDTVNVTATQVSLGADGAGTNTHPFNADASYITSDGLENTNTLTDSSYLPNSLTSQVGNNPGLYLVSHKSNYNGALWPSVGQAPISVYSADYTVYQKRNQYRPRIDTYLFSSGPQIFERIPVFDIHWENIDITPATKAEINTINGIYRLVEGSDNDRTFNVTSGIQPVYNRIIDFNNPVTSSNLVDFQDYAVTLTTQTTGTNAAVNVNAITKAVEISINAFNDSGSLSGITTDSSLVVIGLPGTISTSVQGVFDIGSVSNFSQVNIANSTLTTDSFSSNSIPPITNSDIRWTTGDATFTTTNNSIITAPFNLTFEGLPTATNINAVNGTLNLQTGSIGTIVDNIKTNVINSQSINFGNIVASHTNGTWNSILQNAMSTTLDNIDLNTTAPINIRQIENDSVINSSAAGLSAVVINRHSSDSTINLTASPGDTPRVDYGNDESVIAIHDNLTQAGGIAFFDSSGTNLTMGTNTLPITTLIIDGTTAVIADSSFFCTSVTTLNGGNHSNLSGSSPQITNTRVRNSTIFNSNLTSASFTLENIDGGDYTLDTSLSMTARDTEFTGNFANGRLTGNGVNALIRGNATNNPTMTLSGNLNILGSISGCPNVTAGTFNAGNVNACTITATNSTLISDISGGSVVTITGTATNIGMVEGNSTLTVGTIGTIGDISGAGTVVTADSITQAATITAGQLTVTNDINDLKDISGGTVTCSGNILELEDISGGTVLCTGNLGNIDSATGGIIRCDGEIQFTTTPANPLLISGVEFSKLDGTTRADFSLTAIPAATDSVITVTGSSGINFVAGPATGTYKIVVPGGTQTPTKSPGNNTDNIIIDVVYAATINVPAGITGIFTRDANNNATRIGDFYTAPQTVVIGAGDIPVGESVVLVNQRLGFNVEPITFSAGSEVIQMFTFIQTPILYPTSSTIPNNTLTLTYNPRSVTDPLLTNTLLLQVTDGVNLLQSDVYFNQLLIEQAQQTEENVTFIANNVPSQKLTSNGEQSFAIGSDKLRLRQGTTGTDPVFRERTGFIRILNDSGVLVDNNILLGGAMANAWCFPSILEAPQVFDPAVVADLTRTEVNAITNDQFNARGVTIGNQTNLGLLTPINPTDSQQVDV